MCHTNELSCFLGHETVKCFQIQIQLERILQNDHPELFLFFGDIHKWTTPIDSKSRHVRLAFKPDLRWSCLLGIVTFEIADPFAGLIPVLLSKISVKSEGIRLLLHRNGRPQISQVDIRCREKQMTRVPNPIL